MMSSSFIEMLSFISSLRIVLKSFDEGLASRIEQTANVVHHSAGLIANCPGPAWRKFRFEFFDDVELVHRNAFVHKFSPNSSEVV
jgi:hypothetical protein